MGCGGYWRGVCACEQQVLLRNVYHRPIFLEETLMKKLVVLMAVVVLAMAGQANAELFINGDFEAGAWDGGGSGSGAAYPWTAMPPSLEPSGGSDGGQWMKFDTSPADFSGEWAWAWSGIWNPGGKIAAAPGEEFTVSGMAKHVSDGNTLRAFVKYFDAAGNQVDYDGVNDVEANPDRYMPTWTTGGEWAAFSDTFTVPTVDLQGNPFTAPIAQFDVTFSVETEQAVVGVDELSLHLIPEPTTIVLLGLGVLSLLIRNRFSPIRALAR
jgi:hypothetical protein